MGQSDMESGLIVVVEVKSESEVESPSQYGDKIETTQICCDSHR